jgi:biotin operon repressor
MKTTTTNNTAIYTAASQPERTDEIIEDLNRFAVDYKPDHTDIEWQANVLEDDDFTDVDFQLRAHEMIEDLKRFAVDYKPDHTDIEWQANVLDYDDFTDVDFEFDEWNLHLDELSEEDIDLDYLTGGKWIYSTPLVSPTKDPTLKSTMTYMRIMMVEMMEKFETIDKKLEKLATIEKKLDTIGEKLDTTEEKIQETIDKLPDWGKIKSMDNKMAELEDMLSHEVIKRMPNFDFSTRTSSPFTMQDRSSTHNVHQPNTYEPTPRCWIQMNDREGIMKLHDLKGWLKQQTTTTFKYLYHGVIGGMKVHDLTGWLKRIYLFYFTSVLLRCDV